MSTTEKQYFTLWEPALTGYRKESIDGDWGALLVESVPGWRLLVGPIVGPVEPEEVATWTGNVRLCEADEALAAWCKDNA